jgi:PadR family transcriptional regulator PadR
MELCVLSIISEKEAYPSDIIEKLESSNLFVVEGTLYPLLTRLKNMDLLAYNWQESNSGPPRKYYNLTEKGEKFLYELKATWEDLVKGVHLSTAHLE